MGDVLHWDETRRSTEVRHYVSRVEAERASQSRLDDEAADEVRTAAPEARTHLRGGVRLPS
jgi:glycerol-3-phosphate dehydrogenase